jgi:hypothetical protein
MGGIVKLTWAIRHCADARPNTQQPPRQPSGQTALSPKGIIADVKRGVGYD